MLARVDSFGGAVPSNYPGAPSVRLGQRRTQRAELRTEDWRLVEVHGEKEELARLAAAGLLPAVGAEVADDDDVMTYLSTR